MPTNDMQIVGEIEKKKCVRTASYFSTNQKKPMSARYARAMVAMKLTAVSNRYLIRLKTHSTRRTILDIKQE